VFQRWNPDQIVAGWFEAGIVAGPVLEVAPIAVVEPAMVLGSVQPVLMLELVPE
jgi:hypothetical protein